MHSKVRFLVEIFLRRWEKLSHDSSEVQKSVGPSKTKVRKRGSRQESKLNVLSSALLLYGAVMKGSGAKPRVHSALVKKEDFKSICAEILNPGSNSFINHFIENLGQFSNLVRLGDDTLKTIFSEI